MGPDELAEPNCNLQQLLLMKAARRLLVSSPVLAGVFDEELIEPAGEVLLKFLESEQGQSFAGRDGRSCWRLQKLTGEGLGAKFGLRSGLATESAVLKGCRAVA